MNINIQRLVVSLIVCGSLVSANAEEPAKDKGDKIPPARETYYGRRIAPTMSYFGAPWLIRASREKEERCTEMLENLGVRAGMTVCDMGCGNGFYSLKLAKLVGKDGKVLAVDIQPEMLELLKKRAAAEGLQNIKPVQGTIADPKLPEGAVDLILLVDVYHEFSHPEQMLRAMRRSLKPKGQIVLVEFRLEDPDVPIKLLHKMSKEQILKELPPNGYKLVKQYDKLPWQHMMFFGKAAESDSQQRDKADDGENAASQE